MKLKIIALSTWCVFAVSCGEKEKNISPRDKIEKRAANYSIDGYEKIYTCKSLGLDSQGTDQLPKGEYIFVFRNLKNSQISLDIAEFSAPWALLDPKNPGFQNRGLIRLTDVQMISMNDDVIISFNSKTRGSYYKDYDGKETTLLRINKSTMFGDVVEIKGHASNVSVNCTANN